LQPRHHVPSLLPHPLQSCTGDLHCTASPHHDTTCRKPDTTRILPPWHAGSKLCPPAGSPECELPFRGPNQWPKPEWGVPGFQPVMERYCEEMEELMHRWGAGGGGWGGECSAAGAVLAHTPLPHGRMGNQHAGSDCYPCHALMLSAETLLARAARRTNRLLALALDLPPDYFNDKFSQAALTLRPIHYTAEASDPNNGLFAAGGG
jgi:isopenicillin N synthase-like dioxygenase